MEYKDRLHARGVLHSWLHVGVFAILSGLVVVGMRTWRGRIAGLVSLALLGLGIEAAEFFHGGPGSAFEPRDVLADSFGVLAGLLATYAAVPRVKADRSSQV